MRIRKSWMAVSAVMLFCLAPAFGQNDVRKLELGLFIPIYRDAQHGTEGVGGRVTFNLNSRLGFEGEVSNFTNVVKSNLLLGMGGAKWNWARGEKKEFFFKARSGIARYTFYDRRGDVTSTANHLAFDIGGGMDAFASKWCTVRLDAANLHIQDLGNRLYATIGVTFRFF
jgi:hypothetical protein